MASGGVRCVSPTRSRNSRHLRFFVFSRIREKLNNSEQFWTLVRKPRNFTGEVLLPRSASYWPLLDCSSSKRRVSAPRDRADGGL